MNGNGSLRNPPLERGVLGFCRSFLVVTAGLALIQI